MGFYMDFMVMNGEISYRDTNHILHWDLGFSWVEVYGDRTMMEPTRRLSTMAPSNAVRNGTINGQLCAHLPLISSMTVRSKKGLEPYTSILVVS